MLRADLWAAAFVRRHNDLGTICVVARRGDPVAGQIFIEIDHLDGTTSLLTPASWAAREHDDADRLFVSRLVRESHAAVARRIAAEVAIDPDLWVVAIETRAADVGARLVAS